MARKYRYDTSADALLKPAAGATFFEEWDKTADTQNHDLLCAEMSRLAYAKNKAIKAALQVVDFSAIGFVDDKALGTQAFAATHAAHALTVLAFRGTDSGRFEDIITDLNTLQTDYPPAAGGPGCKVHAGFLKAYRTDAMRKLVDLARAPQGTTLLVTGHSLGGALATLAAVDAPAAKLITFGAPRVGDDAFCAHFDVRPGRRFENCCDLVWRVPPESFTAPHFSQVFRELGLSPLLATPLAHQLGKLKLPGKFAHVAPPCYIRADGSRTDTSSDAERRQDQEQARRAYPHPARLALDEIATVVKSLLSDELRRKFTILGRDLSTKGRDDSAFARRVLRDFFRELFQQVRLGKAVALRDLADHAPINYVSGIAGRL
jgi:pimeloyl-ACP methyl ester carboxylesterase